ncbi:MAG: RNA pseudouridine synthase [Holophagales bacterium]|nr:RNA pseudouridine synthase [Holophagales bacterium]
MTLRPLPVPPGAEAYLAFDKEAGQNAHGYGGLYEEAREALGDDLHLVHRLDRITSGLLLLARGQDALRAAHDAWATRVSKTYVAVVRGVPAEPEGTIDLPLLEHRSGRPWLLARAVRAAYGPDRAARLLRGEGLSFIPPLPPPSRTAVHPAGRPALTRWRLLESRGEEALLELTPATGRMHQLRVHLAAIGHPLLGDPLYDAGTAPEAATGPAPFLRAIRIVWEEPPGAPSGTAWTFEAPASEMMPA